MAAWTAGELDALASVEELEITTYRDGGEPRRFQPIWVVRAGDDIYVRTWHRRETGWYGHAVASGRARVRIPGIETDVTVDDVGPHERDAVDDAYRAKYGRYGERTLGSMVAEDAVASTLRLTPADGATGRA